MMQILISNNPDMWRQIPHPVKFIYSIHFSVNVDQVTLQPYSAAEKFKLPGSADKEIQDFLRKCVILRLNVALVFLKYPIVFRIYSAAVKKLISERLIKIQGLAPDSSESGCFMNPCIFLSWILPECFRQMALPSFLTFCVNSGN